MHTNGLTEHGQYITMLGRCTVMEGAELHGELAPIVLGKGTFIGKNVILRPSPKRIGFVIRPVDLMMSGSTTCQNLSVGEHTFIDEGSNVSAFSIGDCVHIGKNVTIVRSPLLLAHLISLLVQHQRCELADGCYIADNAVLPAGMFVPTLTVAAGSPARIVDELPESFLELHVIRLEQLYDSLDPRTGDFTVAVPPIEQFLGGQFPVCTLGLPCRSASPPPPPPPPCSARPPLPCTRAPSLSDAGGHTEEGRLRPGFVARRVAEWRAQKQSEQQQQLGSGHLDSAAELPPAR